jgi:hypothetical protein
MILFFNANVIFRWFGLSEKMEKKSNAWESGTVPGEWGCVIGLFGMAKRQNFRLIIVVNIIE